MLLSRVAPTVVARTPVPLTRTSSNTSQVYCNGLRAMCHRVIETHIGAALAARLNRRKSSWAGTTSVRATVPANIAADWSGSGGSRVSTPPIRAA